MCWDIAEHTRVVLNVGIFEFSRRQRLTWFEINKKKYILQVSSLYLNFNLRRTAIKVSRLNNMGYLTLNNQFFIPANIMIQTVWNSLDFILIIAAIPQNFYSFFNYYKFGVYNLLTRRYSSILSRCNSKIIIVKNL